MVTSPSTTAIGRWIASISGAKKPKDSSVRPDNRVSTVTPKAPSSSETIAASRVTQVERQPGRGPSRPISHQYSGAPTRQGHKPRFNRLAPRARIPPSMKKKHWIVKTAAIARNPAQGPNSSASSRPPPR